MRISRKGMYDGDEPLLGAWKDIWEHKKKVLMDHQKKKKEDIHGKESAK